MAAGAYLLLSTTVGIPHFAQNAPTVEEHSIVMTSKQTCDKLRDAMLPSPDQRTDTTSIKMVSFQQPVHGADSAYALKTIICTPQ